MSLACALFTRRSELSESLLSEEASRWSGRVRPFEREPDTSVSIPGGSVSPGPDENAPDDSPRSPSPHPSHGAQPCCCLDLERPQRSRPAGRRRHLDDDLPGRRSRQVHRRLRRSAWSGPPRGQRHPHDLAVAGGRRRGRHDQVLDDVRARRMHALPLRRERHDLSVHPPQQRPHGQARQQGQVRCRERRTRPG